MKKRCSKCNVEKELNSDNFYKKSINLNGFESRCKLCRKKMDQERYNKDRDKFRKQKLEYYYKNKDARKKYQLEYYHGNKKDSEKDQSNLN